MEITKNHIKLAVLAVVLVVLVAAALTGQLTEITKMIFDSGVVEDVLDEAPAPPEETVVPEIAAPDTVDVEEVPVAPDTN